MEAQRIVLIMSLAVVTYLMVLAWNEDYGQPTNGTVAEQTQPLQPQQVDLPSQPEIETNAQSDSDLPSASIAPDQLSAPQTSITPAVISEPSIINVETDVLALKIDTRGGDVVEAALKDYPLYIDTPDNPLLLLENNTQRKYIAQSGLIGVNGPDAVSGGRPRYQSESSRYSLNEVDDELIVDLQLTQDNGTQITKRFTLKRDDYLVDISYLIDNQSAESWQGNFFAQLKRDNSADPSATTSMGMASFLGTATTTAEEKYKKIDFDDDAFKEKVNGGWIAILQHYFIAAWVPNPDQQHTYQTRRTNSGDNIAGLVSPGIIVAPGTTSKVTAQLYMGPKIQDRLEPISENLELTVDYGWLWFIAQPLYEILTFIQSGYLSVFGFTADLGFGVGNWGVAIILLTLLVKLAFFQLSATSYKSMANMRRVGPELQRMKERYGDDRQAMSAKMMELYKKEKINPLGGCLPILVQMPVFIALYWVLLESVELRHAPFIFWLNDLAVKDPYFILPILMGATMYIQQLLNPEPPDPMQAKVMKMMPIMFTFFFLWFPAGLVLYWVVNNMLSIAQQWVITRQIEKAGGVK